MDYTIVVSPIEAFMYEHSDIIFKIGCAGMAFFFLIFVLMYFKSLYYNKKWRNKKW